jgi:hypothetical protein
MKLVPQSPIWKDLQEVPSATARRPASATGYKVLRMLPLRWHRSLLLPTRRPTATGNKMWLTFEAIRGTTVGASHYVTDQMTYNI